MSEATSTGFIIRWDINKIGTVIVKKNCLFIFIYKWAFRAIEIEIPDKHILHFKIST